MPQETAPDGSPPLRPAIPTGKDVYDQIMEHIEPDLTTAGRATLLEKYKDESPDQTRSRKKRYQLALTRYKEAFDGYMATLRSQVDRYGRATLEHLEGKSRANEQGFFTNFEAALQSA